mmetsp:Transcript_27975/g.43479  ORF Transcript_27975/g.43479 Transcript_27975/m.43479 type:complete len:558 (+) Transcript_27975:302-1975(+)|eukprot:CAMPEP_0196821158 /NCGR_PEP_ID=MMETSP1362-20130617/78039_1 /TAXON_ID=163516 /ORGANISM="Leptocylindrus danicus, Strain CCMP1856" /LENGTH=557 /DNA_ID=CAMNT_0042200259 /DNA_START=251 /DNA_END=1924 /DNA_ORIENTATION=+
MAEIASGMGSSSSAREEPLLTGANVIDKGGPISRWYHESAWHGMGLFGESFLLFSVGTLKPFWVALYPECWDTHEECSSQLTSSITSSVVFGIIVGMIVIGTLANSIGRRRGSILTASIMSSAALLLFLCTLFGARGDNPSLLFTTTSCLLFLFGVGVGGEYPLSAASASERAIGSLRERLQDATSAYDGGLLDNHVTDRGKKVLLVFTMQGLGIFLNTFLITILLVVTGQIDGASGDVSFKNGNDSDVSGNYSSTALRFIWQSVYAIAAAILIYVAISRYLHLPESSVWADDRNQRELNASNGSADNISPQSTDGRSSHANLLWRNYWHRILGSSLSWLLWDVAFYGNKLFQSAFLISLTGDERTLLELSGAATLNALVALLGYFAAAFIIDRPNVGRFRMQQWGFALVGVLFVACGMLSEVVPNWCLMFLYFASSFFGQCGPNATTFLIPAEIFPTEVRTMCHGIAASAGKIGALIAAIAFNYVTDASMFLICGYSCFLAFLVTTLTIPETTTLDLFEVDVKWHMIISGKKGLYDGPANLPEYSSYYERKKLTYD